MMDFQHWKRFLYFSVCAVVTLSLPTFSAPIEKSECLSELAKAREAIQYDKQNLRALQIIAFCTESQVNSDAYAVKTKEIFEKSHLLSIVPKLLEMAQVKELVPILKEVEVKEDKSLADYLFLNEFYEQLGEPDKQIRALESAVDLDPNDPRPLLLLGSKLLDQGHREASQLVFKNYITKTIPEGKNIYLWTYVAAMAFPISSGAALITLIWSLGLAIAKKRRRMLEAVRKANERKTLKLAFSAFLVVAPLYFAYQFWSTGKAFSFGALILIVFIELFVLFKPVLEKVYTPIFKLLSTGFTTLLNGTRLANALDRVPTGWRSVIAFLSLFTLGAVAPTIAINDLRYGVMAACTLIFYATVGSMIITFLRTSRSLQVSMRWIGVAATLPFLISYIVSNWVHLGMPLMFARLPSGEAINSLINYLVFWGVSLSLALHLSKILANSLIQPVQNMMTSVAEIEKGNFESKAEVMSNDEIGELASAVNRMGEGLAERERVKNTFRRYVDRRVADRILEDEDKESMIAGKTMDAVVLFADIRNFTSMSETSTPQEVVNMLNQFFERMVHLISDNDGVIDKFIGDNMMAVWGVPSAVDNPEEKAITAALAMLEATVEWNKELAKLGKPEIGLGIGINTGSVVAGSIGCHNRMEYTVIGDVVNTAQRAESIAKANELLITDQTYQKVAHLVEAEEREPIKVKGKNELQKFWAIQKIVIHAKAG